MNLTYDIMQLINNYMLVNHKRPTILLVPKARENEFLLFTPYPDLELDPRGAFAKGIFGLNIQWDAEILEVK